jgi:cell division protein FtsQ
VSAGQALGGRLLRPRGGKGARAKRRAPIRRAPGAVLAMLPPRVKRWLLVAAAACLVLFAGYQLWLRDSPLVAVEDVSVTGLTTKDAPRVRASLASAARTMTTLHVDHGDLERAIAAFPVVRELRVTTDFPHGLTIQVVEHRPAALVGGLPVAGDGTVLRGMPVEGSLPELDARGAPRGDRLSHPALLHAARVAGGAPAALRPRLERIDMRTDQGIVVEMRDGPELIFGDAAHVHAKWMAATRVLADPEAAGATYIDVRLPGRPAAGGLPAETLAPVDPASSLELAPPADGAVAAPVDPATAELAPADPAAGTAPATAETAPPATEAPATAYPEPAPAAPEATGGGAGPAPAE